MLNDSGTDDSFYEMKSGVWHWRCAPGPLPRLFAQEWWLYQVPYTPPALQTNLNFYFSIDHDGTFNNPRNVQADTVPSVG